jgi:hypothetical protein
MDDPTLGTFRLMEERQLEKAPFRHCSFSTHLPLPAIATLSYQPDLTQGWLVAIHSIELQ